MPKDSTLHHKLLVPISLVNFEYFTDIDRWYLLHILFNHESAGLFCKQLSFANWHFAVWAENVKSIYFTWNRNAKIDAVVSILFGSFHANEVLLRHAYSPTSGPHDSNRLGLPRSFPGDAFYTAKKVIESLLVKQQKPNESACINSEEFMKKITVICSKASL